MGAVEVVPLALIVTTANDELDATFNAADLSLREAIALANAGLGNDTITFAAAMAGQPIPLSLGQLTISAPLTIRSLGAGQTTVNGQNASRLFHITNTAGNVTFDGLTLTGGKTTADGQGGGAIRSVSTSQLTIQNSTVSGNSTTGPNSRGGGIFSAGSVVVANSTISGNSTMDGVSGGGGMAVNGSATIANSTISGNSTRGSFSSGGGVFAAGSLTVANSTISGNSTFNTFADGGGIYAAAAVTVANSTISGNFTGSLAIAADGGGVYAATGPVTIRNSIVAGNLDPQGGSHPDLRPAGMLSVEFSLIGDNTGTGLAEVPVGTPDPSNGNLIGGGTDATRINPRLGPLANNGGPTQTHALCAGAAAPHASCTVVSPALNAGRNDLIPVDTFDLDSDGITAEAVPFDQRGSVFNRVSATTVDMGALESQPGFPWHNFAKPFDVGGGPNKQPDGSIVASDALDIINYLNAFGAGPVPANAAIGQPFGFLDVSGGPNGIGDNSITAADALDIINFLNAGLGGEGESTASPARASGASQSTGDSMSSELISLLAYDIAENAVSRRRLRS